jgi:hypothetical protein
MGYVASLRRPIIFVVFCRSAFETFAAMGDVFSMAMDSGKDNQMIDANGDVLSAPATQAGRRDKKGAKDNLAKKTRSVGAKPRLEFERVFSLPLR